MDDIIITKVQEALAAQMRGEEEKADEIINHITTIAEASGQGPALLAELERAAKTMESDTIVQMTKAADAIAKTKARLGRLLVELRIMAESVSVPVPVRKRIRELLDADTAAEQAIEREFNRE